MNTQVNTPEITDRQLRPALLNDFVGQTELVDNLKIFIGAARRRMDTLDHVLLYGPPGLGKTTLANIIANEMQAQIAITSGPALERPRDLAGILTSMEPNTVLFIDEIHRMRREVEEILYSAMEDLRIDVIDGRGQNARAISVTLPPFTVIGGTTHQSLLTGPLRDRFGIVGHFDYYDNEALLRIIKRSASIMNYNITDTGASALASRGRGTPRIVNHLLRRLRDFAIMEIEEVEGEIGVAVGIVETVNITDETVVTGCKALGIDSSGLNKRDRVILKTLVENYSGGPAGVEALSATTGEDIGTIREVVEPYLMMCGYIKRTQRGRVATQKGLDKVAAMAKEGKA